MYTILVNNDNELVTTSKCRIMQRSKLVDKLQFLVEPMYNDLDISQCTVLLEYMLPISKKYCTETLVMSDALYKDTHLEYILPIDTNLTKEHGEIELQLSFIYADLDENGNSVQRTRKTSTTTINILPISAWSDVVPDDALNAIDQRLIEIEATLKAMSDLVEAFNGASGV